MRVPLGVPSSRRCVQVSELGLWLDEQRAGLESQDCGRNEEAAEALLKKLDGVLLELEHHRKTVERLQEGGASLQHLSHPSRYTHPVQSIQFQYKVRIKKLKHLVCGL